MIGWNLAFGIKSQNCTIYEILALFGFLLLELIQSVIACSSAVVFLRMAPETCCFQLNSTGDHKNLWVPTKILSGGYKVV